MGDVAELGGEGGGEDGGWIEEGAAWLDRDLTLAKWRRVRLESEYWTRQSSRRTTESRCRN